jgi:hypothetical protein
MPPKKTAARLDREIAQALSAPAEHVGIVYHVTSAKVVPAIRKNGFKPTEGDGGIGVYFWDALGYAKRYAVEGGNWSTLQSPVILAVEVDPDRLGGIKPDFSMVAEVDPDDEEDLLDRYEHTLVLYTTTRVRLPFTIIAADLSKRRR